MGKEKENNCLRLMQTDDKIEFSSKSVLRDCIFFLRLTVGQITAASLS